MSKNKQAKTKIAWMTLFINQISNLKTLMYSLMFSACMTQIRSLTQVIVERVNQRD